MSPDNELLSNGILPGPVAGRGGLIDDDDAWCGVVVRDGECSAFDDWNAERLEVVGGDIRSSHFEGLVRTRRIAFRVCVPRLAVEVHRHPIRERSLRDSG